MARRQRIVENDYKRGMDKQNTKRTFKDVPKKDRVENMLTKAMDKLDEDDDDVKVMNQKVLQARVLAIRNQQLEENKQLEREWIEEQKKLDLMMELERLKALQEMDAKVDHKKVVTHYGCSKIID